MQTKAKTVGIILAAATVLAFLYAILLLQSERMALAVYVIGLGLTTVFFEPYLGLVNYLIFLYLRPQEFAAGFVGIPVMLLLGVATFTVMLVHLALTKGSLALKHAPQNVLMIMFLSAIALSHLRHLYLHGALDSSRGFLSTLVMYLLIANLVGSERRLWSTMHLLVLLTLVLATQGIWQHFTGVGLGGQTPVEGRIRGIGIFADPNDLALTFIIVIPFLYFCFRQVPGALTRIYALAALVVLLYATYLTNSRGGFLSLGFLFVLLLVRSYGLLPGVVGGGLLVAVMFALGPSRLGEISPEEASAYGRIEAWGAGMDMLQSYPVFGVGAGNFMEYHYRTAHNSFVLCASELGLYGLYVWLMMILVSMRSCHFISREAGQEGAWRLSLVSASVLYGFAGFLAAAFFLSRTYNELLYILIGLSAGCAEALGQATAGRYILFERRDLVLGAVAMIAMLLLIKVILVLFW